MTLCTSNANSVALHSNNDAVESKFYWMLSTVISLLAWSRLWIASVIMLASPIYNDVSWVKSCLRKLERFSRLTNSSKIFPTTAIYRQALPSTTNWWPSLSEMFEKHSTSLKMRRLKAPNASVKQLSSWSTTAFPRIRSHWTNGTISPWLLRCMRDLDESDSLCILSTRSKSSTSLRYTLAGSSVSTKLPYSISCSSTSPKTPTGISDTLWPLGARIPPTNERILGSRKLLASWPSIASSIYRSPCGDSRLKLKSMRVSIQLMARSNKFSS
mgnify:CR=1 FL=1